MFEMANALMLLCGAWFVDLLWRHYSLCWILSCLKFDRCVSCNYSPYMVWLSLWRLFGYCLVTSCNRAVFLSLLFLACLFVVCIYCLLQGVWNRRAIPGYCFCLWWNRWTLPPCCLYCWFCCFLGLPFFRILCSVSRMISIYAIMKFSSYLFGGFAGSEVFRDI